MKKSRQALCLIMSIFMLAFAAGLSACSSKNEDATDSAVATTSADTTAEEKADTEEEAETEIVAVTDENGENVTEKSGEVATQVVTVKSEKGGSSSSSGKKDTKSGDNSTAATSAKTENKADNSSDVSTGACFILSTTKTKYAPGEDVTVTISVANAPMTADFDLYLTWDEGALTYKSSSNATLGDMQMISSNDATTFRLMGIVSTCMDLDNNELCDVVFTIPEDAKSGSVIEITPRVNEMEKALDSNGNEVKSIKKKVSASSLKINVE